MNIVKKLVLIAMALSSLATAEVIWKSGDGAVTSWSTYWYVAAENSDGKAIGNGSVTCGGTTYNIPDFPDATGAGGTLDFAAACVDGDIVIGLNAVVGEKTATTEYPWGFSLVGVDLASPKSDVSIAAVSVDLTLGGDCSSISVVAKNSKDASNQDGDYSTKVKTGKNDISLAEFGYSTWAPDPTYNVTTDGVESIHFKHEGATGTCNVTLRCLGTEMGDCSGDIYDAVLPTSNSSIDMNLNGSELSFSTPEMLNVEIYDLQGRVVVTGTVSGTSLDLSNLTQGSYIVRAVNENSSMISKISILD